MPPSCDAAVLHRTFDLESTGKNLALLVAAQPHEFSFHPQGPMHTHRDGHPGFLQAMEEQHQNLGLLSPSPSSTQRWPCGKAQGRKDSKTWVLCPALWKQSICWQEDALLASVFRPLWLRLGRSGLLRAPSSLSRSSWGDEPQPVLWGLLALW